MTEKEKAEIAGYRPNIAYSAKTSQQLELEQAIRDIHALLETGLIGEVQKAKFVCTDIARNQGFKLKA